MSQLCNMTYMFQTSPVLKTRGKNEGKKHPNQEPFLDIHLAVSSLTSLSQSKQHILPLAIYLI